MLFCPVLPAAGGLPEPLSLAAALEGVESLHPDLLLAQADQETAMAERDRVRSRYGFEAGVRARGRYVDASSLANRFDDANNDSDVRVELRKRLYDFGQTRASVAAADARVSGQSRLLEAARQQHRLQVMALFFDVRLADLEFRVQNETMAIAFVRADRMRDRHELGQRSDVELLESESRYQGIRRARYRAEAEQRTTRARLAEALLAPGELPRDLLEPPLPGNGREIPDLDELTQAAQAGSLRLLGLRDEVAAAEQRIEAARAGNRPVLSGVLAASDYNRQFAGDDDMEAELELQVPLMTGGRVAAETAAARAELKRARARLALEESSVRQAVFETLQDIRVLQAQRDEIAALGESRELDLDLSRSLYELELSADLGDSMARLSEVQRLRASTEYELALAWERLVVLSGDPRWSALEPSQALEPK